MQAEKQRKRMLRKDVAGILNLAFYKGRNTLKAEELIIMEKTEEETAMMKQNLPHCKTYVRIKTHKGDFKLFLL